MNVVYTAIFGGSDGLKRAPAGPDRCVCFADDEKLTGPGWEIVVWPKAERPRRAARLTKMTPHKLFPQAEASVWVDGSIEIYRWDALMTDCADAEIACLAHPDRTNCYDEARTVVRLERAHPSKVDEAIAIYRADGFAPAALSTTGLLYRKHTPAVQAFNELWRDHLDRFGINDQVHADYCAWKVGAKVKHLRGHYRDNPYTFYDRVDHHARRQPQFDQGDRCDHYL
ncbi:MAG: glycosyltransferase domain-containing protein, partial [Bradyrhizobium sp.]